MTLDTRTLFVIFTLVTVFMSGAMFFFWRVQKTYDGFAEWVLTAFLAAVCYTLFLLRGVIPDFISVLIANSCIPALLILRLQGTRRFFGRPSVSPIFLLLPAGLLIFYMYFFYAENNVRIRTFSLTISVMIMTLFLAWEFYLNRKKGNMLLNMTIFSLNIIYGLLFLCRGIIILNSQEYRFLSNSAFETFFFVIAPLFEVAWNIFFMMLNSQRTEEELKVALSSAEEANRAKSRFLGVMSHEMRTPLHSIRGTIGLLEESGLGGKQAHCVSLLKRSSNLLQALLDEALDITIIEAGRMKLDKNPFSINELMDEIRELFALQFEAKGIDFNVHYNIENPMNIICDRRRLMQALANLVGNSLKYTNAGKVELSCSIIKDSNNPLIQFTVRDTGIGIANGRLARIFEPFSPFSDSEHRQVGGIGLGLSIVKNICELMGGNIRVESVKEIGSIFIVTLPLQEASSESAEFVNGERFIPRIPPMSILIVDDVPENLELLRYYLEGSRADIIEAATGEDALVRIDERRFDCMLLDMQLPGINGVEVIKRIRSSEEREGLNHLPVIAISANAYAEGRDEAIKSGCDAFVARPFSKNELFETMLRITSDASQIQHQAQELSMPDELIEKARKRISQYSNEIVKACEKNDLQEARRLGHSIKGLGRTFDIEAASKAGVEIEHAAEQGDSLKVIALASELLENFQPYRIETND
jgi:signal transduction histidine kinase/CheY-like chemotaxis protein